MTDANAQLQRKAGPRSGPELYNGRRRQRTSSRAAIKAQVTGNYSYTTSWDTTASITDLFGLMRREFEELRAVVAHDLEAKRLIGSLATALDCLNTIRNRGTLAHPNDLLLEGPEAMLFVNVSRSVLGYLESKLG